ncbi:MBL fold metallo-hydrolase [Cytophagales bacterium LB-30]|uniref:MBL fold metallo-hydrolase n=1 Tax=Shiella aurantiaca TaxID=3058365 RepID=A0ABT8F4H2_9BACT|nr:MBL fold metallo-hydrolase [Shiella aurantiaca]MDN4165144.1 MBL fold metallo-hydrolase [Shiella aurantiaca]
MPVSFKVFSSGYCVAGQHHAQRGAKAKKIRFYATWALIQHPQHGNILFDTGYAQRFHTVSATWPEKIYALLTPVTLAPEEEAHFQLSQQGIKPEVIDWIVISHFHADHIAGLADFPNAKFICSDTAWNDVKNTRGIKALKKGFLPALLPSDFENRLHTFSFSDSSEVHPQLGPMVDVFRDKSIQLCSLSGHAKGMIGALLDSSPSVLLASDAAWLKENLEGKLPHPIVRLFFDSWTDFKDSLDKVRAFHKANPEALIIPCHCEATYRHLQTLGYAI